MVRRGQGANKGKDAPAAPPPDFNEDDLLIAEPLVPGVVVPRAAGKRVTNEGAKKCIMLLLNKCDDFIKRGSRFCHHHNSHWEQVVSRAKALGPDSYEKFKDKMKPDYEAAQAVDNRSETHLAIAKLPP